MIKSILIILLLLYVSCLSKEDQSLESILKEAKDLTFEYVDLNENKEVITWKIPVNICDLYKRLYTAEQIENKNKFIMGISSNNGSFKKGNKIFKISLITLKSVHRPCLIRISEEKKSKTEISFIIRGEEAKEIQEWIDEILKVRSKKLKPIKIEKYNPDPFQINDKNTTRGLK